MLHVDRKTVIIKATILVSKSICCHQIIPSKSNTSRCWLKISVPSSQAFRIWSWLNSSRATHEKAVYDQLQAVVPWILVTISDRRDHYSFSFIFSYFKEKHPSTICGQLWSDNHPWIFSNTWNQVVYDQIPSLFL